MTADGRTDDTADVPADDTAPPVAAAGPRFHVAAALSAGRRLALPRDAARHAQVLRLQPGAPLRLFDGSDDMEWPATIVRMARDAVEVDLGLPQAVDRELPFALTVAIGMPANERMDALVEKATELGAARIVPLECARSVLRLAGPRAEARRGRWQAIAAAACEQCGRTRLPQVEAPRPLRDWLAAIDAVPGDGESRWLLSLDPASTPIGDLAAPLRTATLLSGPEGGLAPDEEAAARAAGFGPIGLGPRILRADTAPLAALAILGARAKAASRR